MLSEARTVLDDVLAKVIREKYNKLKEGLSYSEVDRRVDRARKSLDHLKKGGMPDYHNDWVALLYLIRYQPRQVNLAYTVLNQSAPRGHSAPLCIVDIGCGAWAVPIALAILAAEDQPELGERSIIYHGIEPSEPMSELGEELWLEFGIAAKERGLTRIADIIDGMIMKDSNSITIFPSLDSYCNAQMQSVDTTETPVRESWLLAVHALYEKSKNHIRGFLDDYRKQILGCLQYDMITSDGRKKWMVEDLIVPKYDKWLGPRPPDWTIDGDPVSLPIWEGVLGETTKMRCEVLEDNKVRWDSHNDIRDDAIWVRCVPR